MTILIGSLFMFSFVAAIGIGIIGLAVSLGIYVYAAYEAYRTAQRINRGEVEFVRKSRLFWIPTALFIMIVLMVGGIFTLKAAGFGPTPHTDSGTVQVTKSVSATSQSVSPAKGTGSATQTTYSTQEKVTTLSSLMATKNDLPADFGKPNIQLLKETELTPEMKSFGAITGYWGEYYQQPETKNSLRLILYVISFPEAKNAGAMADSIDAMYSSVKSTKPQENLACPMIGERCDAGRYYSDSRAQTPEGEHLFITFTRGNIFVSLWTTGENPGYAMLKDLAVKTDARITQNWNPT